MLGLNGSHTTTRNMPQQKAEQLVLDQMDKDPSRRQGVQTIQAKIAFDVKQHLTRDFVSQVMHTHDKEGFTLHDPSSKQIFWVKKVPLGIHKHWAGNGHDNGDNAVLVFKKGKDDGIYNPDDPQHYELIQWLCQTLTKIAENTSVAGHKVYWDGGSDKIKAFCKQHSPMCESNWVCMRLGLKDAVVEQDMGTETGTPSTKMMADRHSVNFLIN
ncbi:hypothetical protein L208DRAFT_1378735 [Tricholoma matsutake]|nr:hypothetical protein L208DRAFT_1378735 [Tricholoma matsutake 945]